MTLNGRERVADLHIHSNASDGSDAPARVVQRAHAMGFACIALADHDTVGGLAEAAAEAARLGVEFIPAVELSCLDGEKEIHVLGYGVEPEDEAFRERISLVLDARLGRARGMVEKLNAMGIAIRWERVQELAANENIGRPHVARAMVEAGYIEQVSDAFTDEYIGTGGKAYVERYKITPEEGIDLIRAAGGVPVLAHPGRFRADDAPLPDAFVERLAKAGLMGVEAFYSRHTEAMVRHYHALADALGLLVTGGSDCHGENADEPLMGRIRLPYGYVERLKAAIEAMGRSRAEAASIALGEAQPPQDGVESGVKSAASERSHP